MTVPLPYSISCGGIKARGMRLIVGWIKACGMLVGNDHPLVAPDIYLINVIAAGIIDIIHHRGAADMPIPFASVQVTCRLPVPSTTVCSVA